MNEVRASAFVASGPPCGRGLALRFIVGGSLVLLRVFNRSSKLRKARPSRAVLLLCVDVMLTQLVK